MEPLTLERIARVMNGSFTGQSAGAPGGYSIDSRTMKPGDLFFAITGPRYDGHQFAAAALQRGAVGVVVSDGSKLDAAVRQNASIVTVADTLRGLQDLAAWVRRQIGAKVIGITGSAGKTTTKEMTRQVLEGDFKVHASRGNLNNLYGCPLSLLELREEHQIAVLELGMSTHGELARLAEIADPDIGVLTNVSGAHLANFASLADYADAKGELFAGMRENSIGIFNNDDEQCRGLMSGFRGYPVTFGLERPSDLTASDYRMDGLDGASFEVRHVHNKGSRRLTVKTRFVGAHHVYNALAALSAGYMLGMDLEVMASRLRDLAPLGMRGRVVHLKNSVAVLDDSYNSNPAAMRFALQVIKEAAPGPGGRKVIVFGDMLELGEVAGAAHRDLGRLIAMSGADVVVGVGELSAVALAEIPSTQPSGMESRHFNDSAEASAFVAAAVRPGDLVLVKGSRGIALDKVVAALVERYGEG